jgi:hypothetical protein
MADRGLLGECLTTRDRVVQTVNRSENILESNIVLEIYWERNGLQRARLILGYGPGFKYYQHYQHYPNRGYKRPIANKESGDFL